MKKIIFLFLISFSLAACSSHQEKASNNKTIYTCAMHPQIRQNHPGNCPICGMNLIPVQAGEVDKTKMHPQDNAVNPQGDDGSNQNAKTEIKIGEARASVASVQKKPAALRKLSRQIDLFGQIDHVYDQQVDFTWYYSGRVEEVLINFNTVRVAAGEPILKVYSETALADEEAYLQALRDRWLATFYERTLLTAKVEAVAARLAKIGFEENDLKALEKKKKIQSSFIIRSPITGCLVSPLPHAGEKFNPETMLFKVANLKEIWFIAEVFEQDMGQLRLGQKVEVSVPAYPGTTFTGKLVYIEPKGDMAKRTVNARFVIDNSKGELLPQLSALAKLTLTSPHEVLTIPASAVIDTGKRKLVYVATNEAQYEPREVTLGLEGKAEGSPENLIEVISGLNPNESVVTDGAFLIDAEAQLHGGEAASPMQGMQGMDGMKDMPGMKH
jgi:membrane fusion protein, copper/silver efflux system